jgi:hypothetical protein
MNNTDAALSWCEEHLARNGSLQRDGRTWLCSSPTREDRNPSLSVDLEKRCYFDHGTSESGTLSELSSILGCESPKWEPESEREERKSAPARAEAKPDTSSEAVRLWKSGKPAQPDHEYLQRKHIGAHGCREVLIAGERMLLIPAFDGTGRVVGVERIRQDGTKKHLGEKSGCFFLLGVIDAQKPVVIAEGFSTSSAIHEFSGLPTVCAFGASNVPTLAKRLRERYPDLELIAATDNDDAGVKAAAECPAGTLACIPSGAIPHLDWCDVSVELGQTEARRQFHLKLTAARQKAPLTKTPARWKPKVFTATDLYKADIPEREWSVDDLVPAGLSVLASPPKMGKSWMALQMCLAVASGKPFLGMKTHKGPVLYVSLEDSPLRLRKRIAALVGDKQDIPENLHLMTELPRLDKGGMDFLEEWIQANKPRLVCLDTWGRAKPGGGDAKKNAFDSDYSVVAEVKGVADKYAVALLLIHHLKKGGGKEADFLESLNGSMGLPAAADAILALKRTRGESTAILQRSGRDIEHDDDLALSWEAPGWKAETVSVAEVRMSEERREIIKVLRDAGEPVSARHVAAELGKNFSTIKVTLWRMKKDGAVRVTEKGLYMTPPEERKNDDDDDDFGVTAVTDETGVTGVTPVTGVTRETDDAVTGRLQGGCNRGESGCGLNPDVSVTAVTPVTAKGQNFSEVKRMESEERELEGLFEDAVSDEGLSSRGYPLDAVPKDVAPPVRIDDDSFRLVFDHEPVLPGDHGKRGAWEALSRAFGHGEPFGRSAVESVCQVSDGLARRYLRDWVSSGKLTREGNNRATEYRVVSSSRELPGTSPDILKKSTVKRESSVIPTIPDGTGGTGKVPAKYRQNRGDSEKPVIPTIPDGTFTSTGSDCCSATVSTFDGTFSGCTGRNLVPEENHVEAPKIEHVFPSRGASTPGPMVEVEEFPDPLPLPYEWVGHGWIIGVNRLGSGERSFVIAKSPTGKPVCSLREPRKKDAA